MQCPEDLKLLLQKYANAKTKEEIYIKRTLNDAVELFQLCDSNEYYWADKITRNLCRVIEIIERQHEKEKSVAESNYNGERCFMQFPGNREMMRTNHAGQFTCDRELLQAFYNHYKNKEQIDYLDIWALERRMREMPPAERKENQKKINPTMKDYAARISTFANRYLYEMFDFQQLGQMDPVLFTYENIELILATFKTRDDNGEIVKQRVNIRSALRKLNEFKQEYRPG